MENSLTFAQQGEDFAQANNGISQDFVQSATVNRMCALHNWLDVTFISVESESSSKVKSSTRAVISKMHKD